MSVAGGRLMNPLSRIIRQMGQAVDRMGVMLQGHEAHIERLVPSTRVVSVRGKELQHGLQAFVARSSSVVGDVRLGEMSSIWYGAAVRGDRGAVVVGKSSSIQDSATVSGTTDHPVRIGDDVTIAPGAFLEGCTIEDGAMIGMGARVLAGATVGRDSFVDAGAVVPAGTKVPNGQLWSGNPAEHLRDLTVDEMAFLRNTAATYRTLSQTHFGEDMKTAEDREEDELERDVKEAHWMSPTEALPAEEPDMVEYYKMRDRHSSAGLFREEEFDEDKLLEMREQEELEADKEEEAYYRHLAALNRVGDRVKLLLQTHKADVEGRQLLLEDLRDEDEKAHAYMVDLLKRIREASPDDEEARVALEQELRAVDPYQGTRGNYDAAKEFDQLRSYSSDLLALPPTDARR